MIRRRSRRSPRAFGPSLQKLLPNAALDTLDTGAILSGCGKFRYVLTRFWDYSKPLALFVMLNPSTADATRDDPTIRKCLGFARVHNAGAIAVVNLWAYRATSPKDLRTAGYPVGLSNDYWIDSLMEQADQVIFAWGEQAMHAAGHKRIRLVESLAKKHWHTPLAIKINSSGAPSATMSPLSITTSRSHNCSASSM